DSSLSGPVSIVAGGRSLSVSSATRLTDAEALAVYQVLSAGSQSLTIGARGAATGGSLTFTPEAGQPFLSLSHPQWATVIDNAGSTGTLSLNGDLTNSGILYVVSDNSAVTTANISANNITNNQSGHVTTILPSNSPSGLGSLQSDLSLNLAAAHNVS